ncbi:Beta-1,3-glucan-binding protein [Purpureocillium lavendulum]|uniref:Palmitoyltransferase n=1 Tax=Purpureocillium lavendulum TaxID=1247861 RepID=A0AB34G9K3_9HYPO|nr:Beta-1,3-glucan-binding protein [Purpureocillium lavendulum]
MPDSGDPPASPGGGGDGQPSPKRQSRPASVVSSRMTDIASDDGGEAKARRSIISHPKNVDPGSRPETAKTTNSSRAPWPATAARKGYSSGIAGKKSSIASSAGVVPTRSPSLTTRSHVPSLTSNAFFRPMSSQKLQAHRANVARPPTTSQQLQPPAQPFADLDDAATDLGGSVVNQDVNPPTVANVGAQPGRISADNPRLPSRGTEVTEHENFERTIGNTSPSQGHYPTGSLSDSVQPLQGKQETRSHPTLDTTKAVKDRGRMPSPMRTPRSFRSSFLLPGRSDQGPGSRNRSNDGAEKLSSVNSSPRLRPVDSRGNPKSRPPPTPTSATTVGRVHQFFDGNTIFCLGGRWQNTKDKPINIATGLFVVVPCVLFFVFEAPWLWDNISPAIPITFAYIAYICVSSFIHASVSDPGILPRNLHQFPPVFEHDDPLRVGPPTNDWTLIKSAEASAAAMEVPVKHCRTCNIWRPPRAHHCRLCDNCIETHDHHCVWLNNCVGKRNYRYFFAFVSSATLLAAYLVGTSLAQVLLHMTRENVSFGKAIDHFRVPFALAIIGFVELLYPAALMGYHLFLMARGETTREYINSHKFPKSERYRAFSQGSILRNLMAVLCRPRPPTYYRFKGKYQQGDQRLGTHRKHRPRGNSQGLEMDPVRPPGSSPSGFQGPVSLREQSRG